MAAIFIYGSEDSARQNKLNEYIAQYFEKKEHADLLIVEAEKDKKSIGIDQIKQINQFSIKKPFSANKKICAIPHANSLTIQAQNALLKILEEHPSYLDIYLLAPNVSAVLPTILSRCKRIRINEQQEVFSQQFSDVFDISIGQRLDLADEISAQTPEEIAETFKSWIQIIRKRLHQNQDAMAFAHNTKLIMKAKKDLETTNMNKKLIVEWLLVNLT